MNEIRKKTIYNLFISSHVSIRTNHESYFVGQSLQYSYELCANLIDSGQYGVYYLDNRIIILPNEVFGDIMVLASPPPSPPPVDPENVNTLTPKIFNLSLSNFICGL